MNLLTVEELSVSFDGFKALDIGLFEIADRELRVIIGPNGAGKTTFLDVLCGKLKPDTGKAMLEYVDLTRLTEKEIVEAGVGRKFQTPSIFPSLSVLENLQLAQKADKGVWSSLWKRLPHGAGESIARVADTTGLLGSFHRLAGSLSHGQKQWLEIAMVILQDPKILLVDEPAAGMTDEETYRTGELLEWLCGERAIIVIEHDMTFVRQIARTVTVLHEGRILTEGPMESVQADPRVIECYLGTARRKDAA